MLARFVRTQVLAHIKPYSTVVGIRKNKNLKANENEKREFNAEAAACRSELSDTVIEESRKIVDSFSSGAVADVKLEKAHLSAVFYVLGFDRGRIMAYSDINTMSRLLPQVEQCASSLSTTDLAIVAAAMHRAQLSVSDRRLMVSLLAALSKCSESSPALRILKLLDLSIRRSLPPESLPADEQLVALTSSLSRLLSPSLSPLYGARVMRFWQKLRITTPELEDATRKFLDAIIKAEKHPLRKWRIKDICQAVFTCGFFAYQWSRFADVALEEIEHRLTSGADSVYADEMRKFADGYIQSVLGLLCHSNCTQQDRVMKLVQKSEIFRGPPSTRALSVEAWQCLRIACDLGVDGEQIEKKTPNSDDLDISDWSSQRLTTRQYLALQVADAARAAFPNSNVRITNLLPAFASEAKVDVVIENVEIGGHTISVSFLPLPELACFRRLTFSKSLDHAGRQSLVSFYHPQGSEQLRLRCVVASGLVDHALPILWPTWRRYLEKNRHVYLRSAITKLLSS